MPLSAAYIEFIPWRPWLTIGFGVASALIILGAVSLERAGRLRMSRLLPYLGNASYSIYLLHLPILSASAKLFFLLWLDQVLTRQWSFALLFAVPVACSILAYEWIEKPTLTLTRRLLQGARLRPAAPSLEGPLPAMARAAGAAIPQERRGIAPPLLLRPRVTARPHTLPSCFPVLCG